MSLILEDFDEVLQQIRIVCQDILRSKHFWRFIFKLAYSQPKRQIYNSIWILPVCNNSYFFRF